MKIQLKIKSIDQKSLTIYLKKVKKILEIIGVNYNLFNMPIKRKRITLLKSPHVNKTAREQFEIKSYKVISKADSFCFCWYVSFFLLIQVANLLLISNVFSHSARIFQFLHFSDQ